jgi:hypothetical protein
LDLKAATATLALPETRQVPYMVAVQPALLPQVAVAVLLASLTVGWY